MHEVYLNKLFIYSAKYCSSKVLSFIEIKKEIANKQHAKAYEFK